LQFADITGDSLKLARQAAQQEKARYIVFCGVHFMAETADILSSDDQQVCLPNMRAGCAMADMADEQAVQAALEELDILSDERIVPVTYVNSTAAIKAVTARRGGTCCTSGNVRNVFQWAFSDADSGGAGAGKIFAIPDEHLARNTAVAMGMGSEACVVYDPALPEGGLTRDQVAKAKVICWRGHCYVHQVFTAQDIQQARKQNPEAKIIVHPECPREVVEQADAAGSTEQIITAIDQAPAGSSWLIGTEGNLVARLAKKHPDKKIATVPSARPPRCVQMAQIDLPHLLWVMESLVADAPVNVVKVPEEIASDAKLAVGRMIEIKGVGELTPRNDS
jgi:quinolinate synthase